jgi:hypothetical protein
LQTRTDPERPSAFQASHNHCFALVVVPGITEF